MRLLIQSMSTGRYLVPDPRDGQPTWVTSLRQAGGGVLDEYERAAQLIEDHCDFDDAPVVVDLDRLGTEHDYTDGLLVTHGDE